MATVDPLKIFIGYDDHEVAAFYTLADSIVRHAAKPVAIIPLYKPALEKARLYSRPRQPNESTDFSFTRFLVPYLCNYGHYAVFLDCDMLVQGDIHELVQIAKADSGMRAVWVVKHDYTPKTTTKFLGQPQSVYPRKNWSSVMVFRNKFCSMLTPTYVNTAPAEELQQFRWLKDEEIGDLPKTWGWLVGEYEANPSAKLLHWTIGGPWFREYQFTDQAAVWFQAHARLAPSFNLPKPAGGAS